MKKALLSRCVFQDAHDRRAKDGRFGMSLAVPGGLVRVEPWAGGGAACPQPLGTAGPACRHSLRPWATDRNELAAGGGSQPRLPRLFLLPGGTRTQDRFRRHPIAGTAAADLAASRSA